MTLSQLINHLATDVPHNKAVLTNTHDWYILRLNHTKRSQGQPKDISVSSYIEQLYAQCMPCAHLHVHAHVHNSCSAAWALQLFCWKYTDLYTLGSLHVLTNHTHTDLLYVCNFTCTHTVSTGAKVIRILNCIHHILWRHSPNMPHMPSLITHSRR